MSERRALVVRLDSAGGVLLAGPAVRAVAAVCGRVTLLTGDRGVEAAGLLPGVGEVLTWQAPGLAQRIRVAHFTDALIITSPDESPLPAVLLLRQTGVERIAAIGDDRTGPLLDVRHRVDEGLPEIDRGLSLAAAAGFVLPEGDDGRLAVRQPLPSVEHLVGARPYVAVHPGVAAPTWRWPMERCAQTVHELTMRGRRAVVTGGPDEHALTILVAGRFAVNLGGRTSWAELAAVLAGASAVVACDTGPAHLSAAVGTPVVSPPSAETRAEEIADAVQRLVPRAGC